MAEGELMNHPSVSPLETQVSSEGAGKDGGMEKLDIYLKLARGCMEAVRGMSSREFNDEQCGYLTEKLEAVVQSAISFLEGSRAQAHRPYSSVDIARWVETLKLLVGLAKQIESFVQGCCKEAWMPAAMTLANVAEYVSSLGFNLELCRVALCKERAATGSLTLDEVGKINRDEIEIVKAKASIDAVCVLKRATLELNSSKAEDSTLAKYLLHRLVRVGPNPTSDDDSILVKLFEWVTSGRKAEQLGRGASATVYKVMWLGTPVAKKTFDGPENQEFLQEVRILSQLCHPNITSMFCCSMNKRSCSIIMELMDGSLHDMMQSRLEENGDTPAFHILEGVDIMLQVGEGVNYLHGRRIVHRDLKSMNILVKTLEASGVEPGYVQAKVVDFGLSRTKERSTTYSNVTWAPTYYNVGTSRWMAPEVMNLVPGSQGGRGGSAKLPKREFKCDIYSFATVCFEILTGEVPFRCEGTPKDIKKKVLGALRPKLPDHCPSMLKSLIEKCWSQEPAERPTIGDVCLQLKHLKHVLMTSKSFHGCYTLHMMEPFEVVYMNIKNLPWINQVRVNIFSPFLKELLLVPNGAISIDGPLLFHMHEKLDMRRAVCANKLESLEPLSNADASRNNKEFQHITQLMHFMDKGFKEIKTMYAAMEEKRCATWDMLWAFFPPGERVVYVDKLTDKCVRSEVLSTNYEETQEGPMLFVKVARRDSNSQTWSKYLFCKILNMPSNEEKKKTWNKYAHTVALPAFQGDRAFCRLDICPVRFEEDPKVTEGSFLNTIPERTGQLQRLQSIEAMQLSIAKLIESTDYFGLLSCIGEGSYTRVFHAQLPDRVAAVKLWDESVKSDSEFLTQAALASKLKHDNVVELIGYYLYGHLRVLAYDYAPLGSLHDILHGRTGVIGAQPGPVLDWMQRVKIAVGAAKGLGYLHEKAQPPIVYGGIHSNNVLLYDSYLAKIDGFNFWNPVVNFCLSAVDQFNDSPFVHDHCYHAPEFAAFVARNVVPHVLFNLWLNPLFSFKICEWGGVATQKSDVYNYGVVLLELLTGRRPIDRKMPLGQVFMVTWAIRRLRVDKAKEIIDPKLGSEYPAEAVAKMAAVAEFCVQLQPDQRPSMSVVVKALEPLLSARPPRQVYDEVG